MISSIEIHDKNQINGFYNISNCQNLYLEQIMDTYGLGPGDISFLHSNTYLIKTSRILFCKLSRPRLLLTVESLTCSAWAHIFTIRCNFAQNSIMIFTADGKNKVRPWQQL